MGTRRTPLPGVGTQDDFTTGAGRHLYAAVHHDGRRLPGLHRADAPDTCRAPAPLTPGEATSPAPPAGPAPLDAIRTDGRDPVTEPAPGRRRSPHAGRPPGDTLAPSRTGASGVAVLRRTELHPGPGPGFRLAAGGTLAAPGTRDGVDVLAAIVAGG
ncbi:cation:proton antiporter regulatory subunit [Streptomyces sp. NRRL S-118]|uniref:cation:proton antiporter regulatory subunit n=1 Tax=Streptomyces sp. NRRL S-118 TaxID=1463881 RepID=UPI0004C59388|nr:potassium transporter TrkA [Streptomyces sp. NRRL S-118]